MLLRRPEINITPSLKAILRLLKTKTTTFADLSSPCLQLFLLTISVRNEQAGRMIVSESPRGRKQLFGAFCRSCGAAVGSAPGYHHFLKQLQSMEATANITQKPKHIISGFFITRIKTINRLSCDIMLTKYSVHKQHLDIWMHFYPLDCSSSSHIATHPLRCTSPYILAYTNVRQRGYTHWNAYRLYKYNLYQH